MVHSESWVPLWLTEASVQSRDADAWLERRKTLNTIARTGGVPSLRSTGETLPPLAVGVLTFDLTIV